MLSTLMLVKFICQQKRKKLNVKFIYQYSILGSSWWMRLNNLLLIRSVQLYLVCWQCDKYCLICSNIFRVELCFNADTTLRVTFSKILNVWGKLHLPALIDKPFWKPGSPICSVYLNIMVGILTSKVTSSDNVSCRMVDLSWPDNLYCRRETQTQKLVLDHPPILRDTYIWIYEWILSYWFVYFLDHQMCYTLTRVKNRSTKNT